MRHHLGPLVQLQIRGLHTVDVHGLAVGVRVRERSLLRVLQLHDRGVLVGPGTHHGRRERRMIQRRIRLLVKVLRMGTHLEIRVQLPGLKRLNQMLLPLCLPMQMLLLLLGEPSDRRRLLGWQ